MLGGRGFFLSRSGILITIIGIFVLVPTILLKVGVDHPVITFFTDPFTAFVIIFFVGMASTFQFLRPHWFSLIHISVVIMGAFVYVWALLI